MSKSELKSKIIPIQNNPKAKKGVKSTPTIIARDLTIEGEIISDGLIEIEGRIKGSISGNIVVLREEGIIEGSVSAESISIRGKFNGTIKAKNINITETAKIFGDIEYCSLSVEDGACIEGNFKQISEDKVS